MSTVKPVDAYIADEADRALASDARHLLRYRVPAWAGGWTRRSASTSARPCVRRSSSTSASPRRNDMAVHLGEVLIGPFGGAGRGEVVVKGRRRPTRIYAAS
jgi:hypothetical protein